MSLFAARVIGPVSPISSALRVQGAIPGAMVEVHAQPSGGGAESVVVRGTASSPDQLFGLLPGARLFRGDTLVAMQWLDGDKSGPTPETQVVQVLPAPATPDLGSLVIRSIPYYCGQCLYVEGAYPGATVNLYEPSGLARGTAVEAVGNLARLTVAAPGLDSPDLSVQQTHGSVTGRAVPLGTLQSFAPGFARRQGRRPPAPRIEGPLHECDPAILISGILAGATVSVAVRRGGQIFPTERSACVDTSATFWEISDLKAGSTVTAKQSLCGVSSEESLHVPVGPVHAPRPWLESPCEGDSSIAAHALRIGAIVTLEVRDEGDRLVDTFTGAAHAPSVTFFLRENFLKSGMRLMMRATMCGVSGMWSPPVGVRRGKPAGDPWIYGPLVACQSKIRVINVEPGTLVKIISGRHATASELGCIGEAYATKTHVDVSTIALVPGDSIWAVAYVCRTRASSLPEQVGPFPDVPAPALSPVVMSGPLRLQNLVPGALLEVFVDNVAVLRAITPINRMALPPPPEMKLGSAVRVTQQICGAPARPSEELRARSGTLTMVPQSDVRLQQLTGDTTLGGNRPTLNQTFTRYGLPGMDLGVPIEHMGKYYIFFGDSKQAGASAMIRPIAEVTSYPEDPEAGLALTFLHEPGLPFALLPLRILDIEVRSPIKGFLKALQVEDDSFFVPSGGFSYDGNIYVFVMRKTAHPELDKVGLSYGLDGYPLPLGPMRVIGGRSIMAWAQDPTGVFDSTEICDVRDFSFAAMSTRWKFAEVYAKVVAASSLPTLGATGDILLLWGTGAYRRSDICFAWVQLQPGRRVPGPEGWQYLSAFGPGDQPLFQGGDMTSAIGLMEYSDQRRQSTSTNNPNGTTPGKYGFGEFSVTYVPAMNAWLLLSAKHMAVAGWISGAPWGPWTPVGEGATVFNIAQLPEVARPTGTYGNYGLDRYYRWDDETGSETIYHLASFLGENYGQVNLFRSKITVQ